LAKIGYAPIGESILSPVRVLHPTAAYPILAKIGHSSIVAYPFLAKIGHTSTEEYPFLAKIGYASIFHHPPTFFVLVQSVEL
jgi:hypothetical protein